MLVLSRKKGEQIRIGTAIEVTVLSTVGGKVKLGLSAPPEVTIHRQEVCCRIKAENDRQTEAAAPETRSVA